MSKPWIALAGAGVLLSACANDPHTANTALGGAVKDCSDQGGCGNRAPGHRQYYDEHAGRYYYYDPDAARYYWEDGSPRY